MKISLRTFLDDNRSLIDRIYRCVVGLAVAVIVGYYILSILKYPFGGLTDEPLYIVLAHSVLHGSFLYPTRQPITDPLPGYPILIALPSFLLGSHWNWYWLIGLAQTGVALFFAWRLARKLLSAEAALAVGLLTALNPIIARHAGIVFLDTGYLALSMVLFWGVAECTPSSMLWWALPMALAALTHPYGIFLDLCLVILAHLRFGAKKALLLALAAFLPLGLWMVRNYMVAGTATNYLVNWRSQGALPQDAGNPFLHLARLAALLWAEGFWGIGLRFAALVCLGAVTMGLFAAGVASLIKDKKKEPLVFTLALYMIVMFCLQAVWQTIVVRYIIPILPIMWCFVCAVFDKMDGVRKKALLSVLFILLGAWSCRDAWSTASHIELKKPIAFGETFAWIRTDTPESARFESVDTPNLWLMTGRYANDVSADRRDAWIGGLIKLKLNYVLVSFAHSDGFMRPSENITISDMKEWADHSPYFQKVYENKSEHTEIYRFHISNPDKFLTAYQDYYLAVVASRLGFEQHRVLVRKKLLEAVSLEPTLAYAWGDLSVTETNPAKRLFDLEKAVAADPSATGIRLMLDVVKHQKKQAQAKAYGG